MNSREINENDARILAKQISNTLDKGVILTKKEVANVIEKIIVSWINSR